MALKSMGLKVGYYKPFQSGAFEQNGKLIAPDVEELKKYNIKTCYSYLFKGEVSPHLASVLDDIEIDIQKIKNDLEKFKSQCDFVVIEGAGGLYCPAYKGKLFSDVISELNQEIIIVTTSDLGRINHTLMTIDCAKQKGLKIKGLVINKIPENKTSSQENFTKELKMFCDVEILAQIPELSNLSQNELIKEFSSIIKI